MYSKAIEQRNYDFDDVIKILRLKDFIYILFFQLLKIKKGNGNRKKTVITILTKRPETKINTIMKGKKPKPNKAT